MFCVVECETTAPPRRFRRLGQRRQPGYRTQWYQAPRYCRLTLEFPLGATEAHCRRRSLAGLTAVTKQGCAGVVLPRDFPFPSLPGELGMAVSSPVPLYRRMAGRVSVWAADRLRLSRDTLSVALYGRRLTMELCKAAAVLSCRARDFTVDAGMDTESLCGGLRRYYGISARRGMARDARLYVLFDAPERPLFVPDDALVLNFSGRYPAVQGGRTANGVLLEPPRSLWPAWPEGCDKAALLAAFVASGALGCDELSIRGLCCENRPLPVGL